MSPFYFILASLACYRLTVLLARDSGPFGVFKKLRGFKPSSKLLACPYCVSLWIGFALEAAFYLSGFRDTAVVFACVALALSAVAICLDRFFTSDHQT